MRTNIILTALLLMTLGTRAADVKEGIYEFSLTSPTTVMLTKVDVEWSKDVAKLEVPAMVTLQNHELAVTAIGASAFQHINVERIVLPATVTEVGNWAFEHCRKLTNVNLPASLEEIPAGCFSGCSSLTAITLPKGIIKIGSSAFSNCSSLTKLEFPPSLREVGASAFSQCRNLERVVFNGPLDKVWYESFAWCTKLKEVVFKAPVKSLNGFTSCSSLETVALPEGSQVIESGVFQRCTSLKEITIPQTIREMGQSVFDGCTSLRQVVLPAGVPALQMWLFQDCTSLESLTLGEGLTSIGGSVLNGCKALRHIVVRAAQPPTYNSEALTQEILDMFEQAELVVPTGSKNAYAKAAFWKNFKHVSEQDMGVCYRNMLLQVGEGGAVQYGQWTIGAEGGCVLVPYGEKAVFTLLPDADHAVDYAEVRYPNNGWHDYSREIVDNSFTISAMPENGELAVRFADALVDVDVLQTELGVVTLAVVKNQSLRYQLRPEEGWRVNSLTFNGQDVTDQIRQNTYIDTPVLREKSVIRMAFEKTETGVETLAGRRVRVLGTDDGLVIRDLSAGQQVWVYTIDGRLVRSEVSASSVLRISLPASQVYIVKAAGKTIKIRL